MADNRPKAVAGVATVLLGGVLAVWLVNSTRPAPVAAPARPVEVEVAVVREVAGMAEEPVEAAEAEEVGGPVPPEPVEAGAPGKLSVRSRPSAEVFLDGEAIGTTPLTRDVASGNRRLELRHAEHPGHIVHVAIWPRRHTRFCWNLRKGHRCGQAP